MNRQRGFGWVQFGVVLLCVAIVCAIAWWIQSSITGYGKAKYAAGEQAERVVWQGRENTELADKNAKILALEGKVRELEKKSADDIAALALQYDKEIKDANAARDRALAERRSGAAFGLRWQPDVAAPGQGSGRGSGPAPGAAAGEPAGGATCRLPEPVTDALIALASAADAIVAERNEAVRIAKKDREICTGRQP